MKRFTGWRMFAAALTLAALPLTSAAAASAASQARGDIAAKRNFSNVHVCTKFANGSGNILCAATTDLNDGTPVKGNSSSNLRDINAVYQFDSGGYHVYRLKFSGDTARCIGVTSGFGFGVDIRDCSGGNSNNTNWRAHISCSGTCVLWENNTVINEYLTSDGVGGDQLSASSCSSSGELCSWTPTP